MIVIHGLQQIEQHSPGGIILDHADLLTDNALFLVHACLGKVRLLYKGQQDTQGFLVVI